MGLIKPDAKVELTLEQKQAKVREELNALMFRGAADLYQTSTFIWEKFWANPDLSAQEVFDSFGADALAMAKMLGVVKGQIIDKVDDTMWKLKRLGTVEPVLVNGQQNGHVKVTMNEEK